MRKIVEILEDFWYGLGYFMKHNPVTILMWLGKFIVGFLLIWYWDYNFSKGGKKDGRKND